MQITSYAMNYYSTPAQSNDRGVENNTGNSSGNKTSNAENNTQNNDKNAG